MPKNNLERKKKLIWQERKIWRERRIGAPTKTNLAGMIWRPDKTTSLYYKVNVGFLHRNWYERRTHVKDGEREGGSERERDGYTS